MHLHLRRRWLLLIGRRGVEGCRGRLLVRLRRVVGWRRVVRWLVVGDGRTEGVGGGVGCRVRRL